MNKLNSFLLVLITFFLFSCGKESENTLVFTPVEPLADSANIPKSTLKNENIVEEEEGESSDTGKFKLVFNPEKGVKQSLKVDVSTNLPENNGMSIISTVNIIVKDKSGASTVLDISYSHVKMQMESEAFKINYDSDEKNQKDMGAILDQQIRPFLNKSIELTVDQNGNTTGFKLPDEGKGQQNIGLSGFVIPFSGKEVGVGDTWNSKQVLTDIGNMDVTAKIESVKQGIVNVGLNGKLVDKSDNQIGTVTGNYQVYQSGGLTKKGKMDITMDQGGQPISMVILYTEL